MIDLIDPVLLIWDFYDFFDKHYIDELDLPIFLEELSGDFDDAASFLLLELSTGCKKSLFDPELINPDVPALSNLVVFGNAEIS